MSLMGSLYTGVSGLQVGQNALNTTAHNLSNVDTKGFTRQQVLQATRGYQTISTSASGISRQQIGLGSYYSKVIQARNEFIDIKYRNELGRNSFYSAYANGIEETETLLQEFNGESFKEAYDDLWTAIQTLANEPETAVGKGLLVNKVSVFLERAGSVYNDLCYYQDNLNQQIKKDVDKINYYAKELKSLNKQIMKVEAGGVEAANDLRDQRNVILDELSKLGKITYDEKFDGSVSVRMEGVDLVNGDFVNKIGMEQDDATGFYTPYWTANAKKVTAPDGSVTYNIDGAKVFNTKQEISSISNTDIGGLKGKLITRGDRRADYTDLDANYKRDIANSTIMNVQAQFDSLVHNVATKINELLADAADPATGYLCEKDANGNQIPLQLFQKKATAGYDPANAGQPGYDADGYMIEDPDDNNTLYTIRNLKINPTLVKTPTILDLKKPDDSFDYDLGTSLKKAFESKDYKLNPSVETPCNLVNFYDNLVGQVSGTGYTFRGIQELQEVELESLDFAREEVIGVSSDEELSNMIKFQNAYNAASRYINVVDEMLEHILNTLGA